jgi:CDP-diacylglycerol--glycerol-3-phosphate 3-phosphatidyltransferase
VATAYITLVRFAPELVSGWMAVLIVGREFLVTGLCSVAVQEGMPLRPRKTGKVKTVVQIISVLAVLMAHAWPTWMVGGAAIPGRALASGAIWLMLGVSALSYFREFWAAAMLKSRQRRAAAPFAIDRPEGKNVAAR